MNVMKSLGLVAVLVTVTTVNAYAIGEREKGALIGAGAVVLLPTIVKNLTSSSKAYHSPVHTKIHQVHYVKRSPKQYKPWKRNYQHWTRHHQAHKNRDVVIIYK